MSEEQKFVSRPNAMPMPADFANLQKLVLLDLKTFPYQISQRLIGTYKKEDIKTYLEVPEIDNSQIQLRYISRYLYNASSHYKRLINYFAHMLPFDYVVEPILKDTSKIDPAKYKKAYQSVVSLLEGMNIKHEFQKIMPHVIREDAFYGYIHMNKDSFFIQRLNPDYCKLSSYEDGVYNVAFDFTYFFMYPNRLKMFPQEFQDQFIRYAGSAYDSSTGKITKGRRADGDGVRWRELDSKMTIVIKANEDLDFLMPPFVGVFGNLLDIEDFKQLKKAKAEIGNYKLLVQRIPMRDGSENNNDYAITFDQAMAYHNNVAGVLPEQIGLATTPMEVDLIDFERDRVDNNQVAEEETGFWNAAGVAQPLFGSDASGLALPMSMLTDENDMFALLRQFERWLNRFLKQYGSSTYQFKVSFLNVTENNRDEVVARFNTAAQFGLPVKSHLMASLGLSPSAMVNMAFLENDILEVHENFIPLQSAHTMSGDDNGGSGGQSKAKKATSQANAKANAKANGATGGRPQSKTKDLTASGAKTRESGSNKTRGK